MKGFIDYMSFRIAAFSIGLVIALYWLRVLRMARKARRTTARRTSSRQNQSAEAVSESSGFPSSQSGSRIRS